MKYTTKELKPGILSIQLTPENDIESKLLVKGNSDNDEIIDVYYQDAVNKYNSNYELVQVIDIAKWPNAAVVKYEVVK
ncbi:hypothetical protein [Fulvivirga sp.]|uniref:hypothetical protein n=1 Tax=Fulvivirga sp. TaxID=1931237 RepID=UPI0032EC5F13